ncbi:hypothetical protein [Kibdelosporangium phytohabitans]|uniref:Uncharacterized protein n=1 Tax=Kibdelosporangium phytohabitans TaxID=860235 RepID=A0A0N9I2I9_9PSEU|nr:hypothetical protein [Kibdelosporangium phytohabitans]ALG08425.1 hypothetical protein AOZ06_17230 [Kibdelosporangium phytohabitans]MBE1470526.1 hypothetical protein [Kibdelosporangium phytohabitans]
MNDATSSRAWSHVCEDFGQLARDANLYGLSGRWRALVDGTRSGGVSGYDWLEFLAELDEYREAEEDFVSRSGFAAAQARAAADGGYVCPAGLCGRYEQWSALGEPPPCALFQQPLNVVP